ncbi:MAG: hypothetical protein H6Q72_3374 [Firmicutes bacterium]|nr:hypothetical protein [Bacillota bacterium]
MSVTSLSTSHPGICGTPIQHGGFICYCLSGSVPASVRAPIASEALSYGKWAWFLFHGIVLLTTFGAGIFVGLDLKK